MLKRGRGNIFINVGKLMKKGDKLTKSILSIKRRVERLMKKNLS